MKIHTPAQAVVYCEIGALLALCGCALAYGMQYVANLLLVRIG